MIKIESSHNETTDATCTCEGGAFMIGDRKFVLYETTINGICQQCHKPRLCKTCGKMLYPLGCRCGLPERDRKEP